MIALRGLSGPARTNGSARSGGFESLSDGRPFALCGGPFPVLHDVAHTRVLPLKIQGR